MLLWLKPKLNQHFYSLTTKVFWIVINITLISNIQSIISIVHDIYFIIKHDNNFLLILQVPVLWIFLWILFLKYFKHLLFSKTLLYLLWLIVATTFLLTHFVYLCSLLSSTKNKCIFDFSPTNSSIATSPVLPFISFCQQLICLNHYVLTSLIISKIKHFTNQVPHQLLLL